MKTFFIYGWIVAGALAAFIFIPAHALAATNINSTTSQHFAWNDEIGWIDFYSTGNVNVSSSQLSGYASSSVGSVSLDCATSPSGNICVTSNYKVANNGGGSLSGWAWNDEIGWISFYWGNTSANPAVSSTSMCNTYSAPYSSWCGVTINSSGVFQGFAWNDVVGWISFNCNNTLSCGTSNYEVATSWAATSATGTLDSQTFDTGVASGAQLNSITWKGGAIPTGASVELYRSGWDVGEHLCRKRLRCANPAWQLCVARRQILPLSGHPVDESRADPKPERHERYRQLESVGRVL